MNKTVYVHNLNMNKCVTELKIIIKNITEKKTIDDALDYLLDKKIYNDIKQNIEYMDLLYADRSLSNDTRYCDIVVDFTQPKMRKINSVIKMYGRTLNKLSVINKALMNECHGEDSNNFFTSTLNELNNMSNRDKNKPSLQCPMCPACDDTYFKVLYRNICFSVIIILTLSFLVLFLLFDINFKYKF